MKSNNKFKIGEFSKLNRVTVKALRHYEEIGLLKPNEVDEWTGYRYYDVSQFKTLSNILYLKRLRFSLAEIKELFEDGLESPSQEMIQEKLAQCQQEQDFLKWQHEELLNLEKHLHKQIDMEKVIIKSLPSFIAASYRKVLKSYDELGPLCYQVIGPEMQRCGCKCTKLLYCYTFEHSRVHKETNIDVEYCEAVDEKFTESESLKCKEIAAVKSAVCYIHKRSYNNFQESMTILMNYIEKNGYEIADYPRFSYLEGPWSKEREEDYITEIQVPVK